MSKSLNQNEWRTLDLTPDFGEMIKPAETIDISGIAELTLQDKRVWNELIANAFGPNMREAGYDFKIDLTPLRANHNSNERIEDSIERLMTTIARFRRADGSITRFQLLGGNNMGDPNRPRGELTYSFDKRLIEVLRDSISFGKLELSVMAAFGSKYALSLYEHLSRRVNLRNKWMQEYTVDELRDILGVGEKQYPAFGNLKQRVIIPAMDEVNMWAPFTIHLSYKKTGQRVTKVHVNWTWKDRENRARIRSELDKSKTGRKARASNTQERIIVLEPDQLHVDDTKEPFLDLDPQGANLAR